MKQITINNILIIPSLDTGKTVEIQGTPITRNADKTLTVNGTIYNIGESFVIGNRLFTFVGVGSPTAFIMSLIPAPSVSSSQLPSTVISSSPPTVSEKKQTTSLSETSQEAPFDYSKYYPLIGVVVFFMIIIGGVVYFFMTKSSKSKTNSNGGYYPYEINID